MAFFSDVHNVCRREHVTSSGRTEKEGFEYKQTCWYSRDEIVIGEGAMASCRVKLRVNSARTEGMARRLRGAWPNHGAEIRCQIPLEIACSGNLKSY